MKETPKLDIVIVNWNAGPALRECLESIVKANADGYKLDRVTVVDNDSSDGSAKGLAGVALPLNVVANDENRGFAAACNQGAQGSHADYLLFLNPDTRVFPNTLANSVEWMSRPDAARVGILGVQLVDEKGDVARTCARFPVPAMFLTRMLGLSKLLRRQVPEHFYTEWDHKDSRCVDQVMGAYFLVRNSLFRQLGGFDERFFVYFEEVDFCLQAKRAGWDAFFLATAQCYHRGCGTTDQVKARRLYYSLQSRILYAFKNLSPTQALVLMLATLVIEPVARLTHGLASLSLGRVREVVQGFWLLWRAMPGIMRTARHAGQSNASPIQVTATRQ